MDWEISSWKVKSHSVNYHGVPVLDWVLLLVLIGLGVEAYITTRPSKDDSRKQAHDRVLKDADPAEPEKKSARTPKKTG
jgi:hypothetical protein